MIDRIDHWRLFIAIELAAEVRRRITQHIDRLRAEIPDVRASWVREENLHLTVKFLGDTPAENAEALSQALRCAAAKVNPFDLIVAGSGIFPLRGKPNVLWIGISAADQSFTTLHRAIEDACEKAGFSRDNRPFHPHLTIARLRHPHGARELAGLHKEIGFDALSAKAKDVCLIRSELSSEGSRYTIIARQALGT